MSSEQPLEIVITGGGVAALEAVLALRELAGDRVRVLLLTPEPNFVYRPTGVLEPFSLGAAERVSLAELALDLGFELRIDRLESVDPVLRTVRTAGGGTVSYDALLLALGASRRAAFSYTLTLEVDQLGDQLTGLVQDIEGGYVASIAFLIPERPPWPLPIYELALLCAQRAHEMNVELEVTIVTPEISPLAAFGSAASGAVARRLIEHGIRVLTGASYDVRQRGAVTLAGSQPPLTADQLVALPELHGPVIPGIPREPRGGFVPIDEHCRVRGLERVFAAGDATDHPIKHGGLAAQQADAAAEAIAVLAGVELTPAAFDPRLEAILVGGGAPLPLSSTGEAASLDPSWGKIRARHLMPYLVARRDRAPEPSRRR